MTTGEKIRQLRKARGYTQDAVAAALDVSRQAVAKWESGQSLPSTGNLLNLAQLLGVPLEELLEADQAPGAAWEEYARQTLAQEQARRRLREGMVRRAGTAAAVALGYGAVYIACLAVFYLAGVQTCVWHWMRSSHVLPVTCLVHLAAALLDKKLIGLSLLAGTVAAIPLANAAGLYAMERSPIGYNNGRVIYLAVLFACCAVGCVLERRAAQRRAEAPPRRRRAAGAAFAAVLCALFLACAFLSVRHVKYGLGAEDGYRDGYAAGAADAQSGKPMDGRVSNAEVPAQYTFGSTGFKGYMVYWPTGYHRGYDDALEGAARVSA